MTTINKIAVIGAGVMGSGIAAQITNAGYPVILLDIVPPDFAENGDKYGGNKNAFADGAVKKMLKADPAPFMRKSNAKMITTGNLDDDLGLLKECDWIIEVVLEKLEVKHATYKKIEANRKKGSIVSSNTSTIPLHKLIEGQPDSFARDFMITHFFNPPRYMRLMELVVGEKTNKKAADSIHSFCDVKLGKGVVQCHDTPGFIANRLGVFWLTAGVNEAVNLNVPIEIADGVMSKPVGIPKTGVFGLIDLVGIDLMPKLSESLLSSLPKNDAYRDIFVDFDFVHQMIDAGYTGRKGKGGFYRLNPDAPKGKKEKQTLQIAALATPNTPTAKTPLDPQLHYKKSNKGLAKGLMSVDAGRQGLRAVLESDDIGGKYARSVLLQTLAYAAELVGEVADTVFDIDDAMKLGYNWKFGPFEMIDALGVKWFADALEKDGVAAVPEIISSLQAQRSNPESSDNENGLPRQGDALPRNDGATFYRIQNGVRQYFGTDGQYHDVKRPDGVLLLRDIKLSNDPIMKNGSASVWDIGDGVLCFEQTSKMNTFDEQTFEMLGKTIKTIGAGDGEYKALVVYNEASHFSAGANLGLALFMINIAMYPQVESFIAEGQKAFMNLKYAPFPVVSAPSGMALGGGCEILLSSDAVQAHAETYCGLVEVGVGVIPGWGGCKEMILRYQEKERAQFAAGVKEHGRDAMWFAPDTTPMGATRKSFETIGMAQVAKSAFEAKDIGYFRESDGITMNRDRLLYDAKHRALKMAKNYTTPEKREDIRMPGPSGKRALDMAVGDLHSSGKATDYDVVVSDHLAKVLSGGKKADWTNPISEDDLLKLELEQFSALIRNEGTMARIEHMLTSGKPLRN